MGSSLTVNVTQENIIENLQSSSTGLKALQYLEENNIVPKLIYDKQIHTNRGEQQGNVIKIYMSNIYNSPLIAGQTVIHEVCHHQYGIGQSQWAEAVCMAKEKMHKENREYLTVAEKRRLIKLAKDNYPEFNWRKGGYENGKRR